MSLRGRRLLLAAGSALLIATPGHAAETCVVSVCVDPAFVGDTIAATGVIETGLGSGGDGVVCQYVKLMAPPPQGWSGGGSTPPYVFSRPFQWGEEYPNDYDFRACPLLCVTANPFQTDVCVMPPGSTT